MITVILNVYKRPYLEEQIKSIENSTIQPKEIIINQNGNYVEIPKRIKDKYTVVQSNKNWGVWFRFVVALHSITEYVCIIDDDTIIGKKRFENCLDCMQKQPGLYGTVGHIYQNRQIRSPQLKRPGWAMPNNQIEQTDICGHNWFFKTEWLKYFFEERIPVEKRPYNGEDIWLSYSLQKHGINSYCPPHPMSDLEMWGSHGNKATQYGNDNVANWKDKQKEYQEARAYIINKGFKLLTDKND